MQKNNCISHRFAVISDIHGNLEALQKVLKTLRKQKVSEIICLGDVVGYGPNPEECWALIKQNCSICLEGNHEAMLLNRADSTNCSLIGQQSALWTSAAVSSNVKNDLAELSFGFEKYNFIFLHSGVDNDGSWRYLNKLDDMLDEYKDIQHSVFYGHTHRPRITIIHEDGQVTDEKVEKNACYTISLTKEKCYINPGSVGQQRDTHTDASFVICETDGEMISVEFFRIPYNSFRVYEKILEAGLGKEIASYLIREKEKRRIYEIFDYWRQRISRSIFTRRNDEG